MLKTVKKKISRCLIKKRNELLPDKLNKVLKSATFEPQIFLSKTYMRAKTPVGRFFNIRNPLKTFYARKMQLNKISSNSYIIKRYHLLQDNKLL